MSISFLSYELIQRGFRSVSDDSRWKVSKGTATFLAGGMASNACECAGDLSHRWSFCLGES